MARVHIVYPHGASIATPDAIGRHLGEFLESHGHEVVLHDWDSPKRIRPRQGDLLVGHPHPIPGTVLRRSWDDPAWARRLVLCPYVPDLFQAAFTDEFVRSGDGYLAITGKAWFDAVAFGPAADWKPAMVHLDLAVERADFPRIKHGFNPPGQRRYLYIGHNAWYKNPDYLSAVATRMGGEHRFGWIGGDAAHDSYKGLAGLQHLGMRDTSSSATHELLASYDFLVTLGTGDANPTTVLEAMSWGLIPVCTPTSGYIDEPGIVNVPLHDVDDVVRRLQELDALDESRLLALQAFNDGRLNQHFTWQRFGQQVEDALLGRTSLQPVGRQPLDRQALLAAARLVSPLSPWRRGGRTLVRSLLKRHYPGQVQQVRALKTRLRASPLSREH